MPSPAPVTRRALAVVALSAALAACGDATPSAAPAGDAAVVADVVVDVVAALDAPAPAVDVPPEPDVPIETFRPDAASPQTAITAPADTWTWVPFPDSACGNGEPTGVGVSLHPGSRRVVIFLQGGGACWDGFTCYGVNTAVNLSSGYGPAAFASETRGLSSFTLFNRNNARNPWRDANLVYVPYCTGDVHGGDRIIEHRWGSRVVRTFHVGARNMDAFLRRLRPTFPDAERVTLSGLSAGGFGAGIHWERVAEAFPGVRVDLLDDSGPPMAPPGERWAQWRNTWNVQLPAGCPECRDRLEALLPYYARRFPPPARLALLSYTQDTTISAFFGVTPEQFEAQLDDVTRRLIDPIPNARRFYVADQGHVLIGNSGNIRGADGTVLIDWLGRMNSDDPAWANVLP
ncbi:MAG: pectin acetylesterase-family hydrolase [Deltaproteobacteria bacterium]|nr:pectin acetylesterase-family hydrolase [Myxococcales bacterium]MDP3216609.1 pectin acetylesterase-family hydrolase [Deltaproteobacteria bacterium]